ncbi:nicotinamide mononucleotide transporter [Mycoplasmopsis cynos]|uniref:nicotinamide mononucleotide transporter n=1 Tax=Mycoplasmopsis cynos TaxID=171284 RepID=UPI002AFFE006|nr:nicotinamide mononucleotide transporter [Mycoplasmopsis cynos]WQQ15869.1 nicotinamide mononucleotide transporter [Mycoplasmopsis cynos]
MLFIFSIYNIDTGTLLWKSNISFWRKLINIFLSLSGFLGVISIYLFAKKSNIAYIAAILNALLYCLFSFTNGLVIDGFLQIIYIFILLILYIKQYINKNKKIYLIRNSIYSSILFVFYFLVFFIAFYFLNPLTNSIIGKILNIDYLEFGSNFNYKIISAILLAIFNSVSVVALTMMAAGFRDSWIIWCIKNILCFIFFSGIAFLSFVAIIVNFIYFIVSIYLYLVTSKDKSFKIAFIGMGASGKSTIIGKIGNFLKEYNIKVIHERNIDEKYENYMKDLKKYGYKTQKIFFKDRYKQIKEMQQYERSLIDRHMIDDFLYPKVLMDIKCFTKLQRFKWNFYYKVKYYFLLSIQPKVDLTFVILRNYKEIKKNREKASKNKEEERRKLELKNDEFFKAINQEYLDDNNTLNPLFEKKLKYFSKKYYVFINEEWENSTKEIKEIIMEGISNDG